MMFVAILYPFSSTARAGKHSLALCACQQGSGKEPGKSDYTEDTQPRKGVPFVSQRSYHEIPSTSVDWDFEWVKYVATGSSESEKPKTFSPWEKLKRQSSSKFPRRLFTIPRLSLLTKDWRFWVTILFLISLIMAAIQRSNNNMMGSGFI
ncbi:hypothetical protein GpartN1_g4151.t1 [Galdieria partita]|uniref:Uncharacterized protein n=1 Tax=Galdieria partita TaxID=83374 RepID=A0A9C7PXN8_9RHOD|nr:hypothetical protein GpartN1_g4151.t1 [Galdieria partita]